MEFDMKMALEEEDKEPGAVTRSSKTRPWPLKLLQIFLMLLLLGLGISISVSFYSPSYSPLSKSKTLFACFKDPNITLAKWIKPTSNLMHKMNDAELFWRASLVPGIKEYPFERVPKIAFMFLTKGPLPLSPLWERFFKGNEELYSIYIHSTPSYVEEFSASSVFYKRQIPSQIIEWGRMSMCDGEKRLLANALLDISNEWFILLSESCIPLHNLSTIYRYISESQQSFMGSFDDPGPHGRGRYSWNMQPEVKIEQWRKGSQWFEVNRQLAINIIEDQKYYPKFNDFCIPSCYVDEHYFPTMLSIIVPNLIANRSITWTDWSRGGAHPATFGDADVTKEFFRRLFEEQSCTYNDQATSICFLFGRKFAPSALKPLLGLASEVFWF